MIKPPFTLLVLKSPHRPVAIRISVPLFFLLLFAVPVLWAAAGYGLSLLFHSESFVHIQAPSIAQTGPKLRETSVSPASSTTPLEISGLFVTSSKGGGTDITFSLSNTIPGDKYYLWIVANPDAAGTDGSFIYPRNPVFRGLPVDYRNGVPYDRSQGGEISVTIGEDVPRLTVEKLRILVYTAEGKILTDKQFAVGQNERSTSP